MYIIMDIRNQHKSKLVLIAKIYLAQNYQTIILFIPLQRVR